MGRNFPFPGRLSIGKKGILTGLLFLCFSSLLGGCLRGHTYCAGSLYTKSSVKRRASPLFATGGRKIWP